MIGLYLSGTGNTKHCIEKLLYLLDETSQAIPIENENVSELVLKHHFIILAYPTQFSNAPLMVRDFIKNHADIWKNKEVICVATMGLFSGDGTGCTARILRKYGAKIVGGLHIQMPDSVCDVKLLKKTLEENRKIIKTADKQLENAAIKIKRGIYPKDGLYFFNHIVGLLGQRLWYYRKTKFYTNKLKISKSCIGCGLCVKQCPMKNLTLQDKKTVAGGQCTMCYRCISSCPQKAITLLGTEIVEQCRFEKYI